MGIERTPRGTMLGRGFRRRCPHCGAPAFRSWFRMREVCTGCGLRFEREPGYWVGAVTINTTVTFGFFVGLFVALTIITWPDPPWAMIMAVTVAANLALPVFFYPLSRTIWAAMEISWHPLEVKDFEA